VEHFLPVIARAEVVDFDHISVSSIF